MSFKSNDFFFTLIPNETIYIDSKNNNTKVTQGKFLISIQVDW